MYRSDPHARTRPTTAPPTMRGEPGSSLGRVGGDAAPAAIVTADDGPALLTEVDSRRLAGNAGTVTLYLAADGAAARYLVDVEGAAGERVARIAAATPADALDGYRHPFARPEVPDIFNSSDS